MPGPIADKILSAAREAAEAAQGKHKSFRERQVRVPENINVKSIRAHLDMTQQEFSQTFGFPERTVKSWESGDRKPEKSARILLRIIEHNPQAVFDANL